MTVRTALAEGTGALERSMPGSPFLDAVLLLGLAMNTDKARLLSSMPDDVDPGAFAAYRRFIERRASGESVAYILGFKEFYGRRYAVDPRVLVPRPDTELLVEVALSLLPPHGSIAGAPTGGNGTPRLRCHDACTGSGCVGISIAAERPDVEVSLSDISPDALELARANARSILGRELSASIGDLLAGAAGVFDLIVANPPYVTAALAGEIGMAGGREPAGALDGGIHGLDLYPALTAQAWEKLRNGGALAVEIGEEQGPRVAAMFEAAGFEGVTIRVDLSGSDRVVAGGKHAER
ncbi:MAG: peptide chain release factor N(5)-glutamine methyltransferase [Spirochaetae bacterium HGW-Spirochaetae-7]|jgi:release factor glutamine methyltransferase|nr:MAG: peptide chain release factor N(5)-glutamine methyltransferase [Spirochaetae bacterium HGW-Spirochaetae-7]